MSRVVWVWALCLAGLAAPLTDLVVAEEFLQELPEETNLREQLRIAQKAQAEQLREIRNLRAEVDRLQEENARLEVPLEEARGVQSKQRELEREREDLQGKLTQAQADLQRLKDQSDEREQSLQIENQSLQSQVDRLENELESAQKTHADLLEERSRLREQLESQNLPSKEFTDKPIRPDESQMDPFEPMLPNLAGPGGSWVPVSDVSWVEILEVGAGQDVLVFSIARAPWVTPGSELLILKGDRPIGEMEVSQVDPAGLAMAYLTRKLEGGEPLQSGQILSVRPLASLSGEAPQ